MDDGRVVRLFASFRSLCVHLALLEEAPPLILAQPSNELGATDDQCHERDGGQRADL